MNPNFALLTGLVLLGTVSPLLTFAALFQQKEWRWDRLTEHLRRDGWFNQLSGKLRPALCALYLLFFLMGIIQLSSSGTPEVVTGMQRLTHNVLTLFALLSGVQIVLRKQRMPVWTSKAMLVVVTALLLNAFVAMAGWQLFDVLFPAALIVLLQPLMILIAWALWKPVDAVLKTGIMKRAAEIRATMTDATVIGIAGSVGKTTVKELIAHLTQDLHPLVTPLHVNSEMGVAQWLLGNVGAWHAKPLLIVEMGAYRTGEIAMLCRIAQPTIGVMTALGSDHLALFGSESKIDNANAELLEALPSTGHAFLNGFNERSKALASRTKAAVTITGTGDLTPTNIQETDAGIQFSILHSPFSIPLHGTHNLHNAVLALAVARSLGVKDERIAELLHSFTPQAHTFSIKTEAGVTILDDTYNISPLSLRAALDWAATRTERPRVLLTSGLQESGSQESAFLQELGQHAQTCVDRVIFTSPHGSKDFSKGFAKTVEILSKDTDRVSTGSLLLAVGRMPLSNIQRLLPTL